MFTYSREWHLHFQYQYSALTGRWKYIVFTSHEEKRHFDVLHSVFLVASRWKCDESTLKDASVDIKLVLF